MSVVHKTIGFVVDNLLPSLDVSALTRLGPRSIFTGAASSSAMGFMRFGWIAAAVNAQPEHGLHYELYRPLRKYDLLVFVKSMSPACLRLAQDYRRRGRPAVFDINVNYFDVQGTFYYDGMQPTPEQIQNATTMAGTCEAVITASLALEEACRALNPHTIWLPDNVDLRLVPAPAPARGSVPAGRLRLLWSGQAAKLFDLLVIEDILRAYRERLELVLITTDLAALDLVFEPYRSRLKKLLADLACQVVPFRSIAQLLALYGQGGVLISPRFLDSSYNLSHTEWKITLGMACGRCAVCSPQRSYREVARRSRGQGIRICTAPAEWAAVFEAMLGGRFAWEPEEAAARQVVAEHYATPVIARQHAAFVNQVCERVS